MAEALCFTTSKQCTWARTATSQDCRFPVQYVIRPQTDAHRDFRGYAGRIASGVWKPGDKVVALPSGKESTIDQILVGDAPLDKAFPPLSVTMTLTDDIDLSRGDMVVRANNQPESTQALDARICWLSEAPLNPATRYVLRHTTRDVQAKITEVLYRIDINTLRGKCHDRRTWPESDGFRQTATKTTDLPAPSFLCQRHGTRHFSNSLEKLNSTQSGKLIAEINGWPNQFANTFIIGGLVIVNDIILGSIICFGIVLYNPIVFTGIAGFLLCGILLLRFLTKEDWPDIVLSFEISTPEPIQS